MKSAERSDSITLVTSDPLVTFNVFKSQKPKTLQMPGNAAHKPT